jgi:hypothetical protein
MRRPSWKFSLRTLMVLTAIAPIAVYWLCLPTLVANRYAAALNNRDFAAADRLCLDSKDTFPGDWAKHKTFDPRAVVAPLTWHDFRHRERRLYVAITYGDSHGLVGCGVECRATTRGINVGMFMP